MSSLEDEKQKLNCLQGSGQGALPLPKRRESGSPRGPSRTSDWPFWAAVLASHCPLLGQWDARGPLITYLNPIFQKVLHGRDWVGFSIWVKDLARFALQWLSWFHTWSTQVVTSHELKQGSPKLGCHPQGTPIHHLIINVHILSFTMSHSQFIYLI